jgi:hypothetical protein
MLKIIGRILIILLVTAVIGTAIYFIATGTSQTSTTTLNDAGFTHQPQGGGGNGLRDGSGSSRGGGDEAVPASQAWLDLLKDVLIIAIATLVVVLLRVAFRRKRIARPTAVS